MGSKEKWRAAGRKVTAAVAGVRAYLCNPAALWRKRGKPASERGPEPSREASDALRYTRRLWAGMWLILFCWGLWAALPSAAVPDTAPAQSRVAASPILLTAVVDQWLDAAADGLHSLQQAIENRVESARFSPPDESLPVEPGIAAAIRGHLRQGLRGIPGAKRVFWVSDQQRVTVGAQDAPAPDVSALLKSFHDPLAVDKWISLDPTSRGQGPTGRLAAVVRNGQTPLGVVAVDVDMAHLCRRILQVTPVLPGTAVTIAHSSAPEGAGARGGMTCAMSPEGQKAGVPVNSPSEGKRQRLQSAQAPFVIHYTEPAPDLAPRPARRGPRWLPLAVLLGLFAVSHVTLWRQGVFSMARLVDDAGEKLRTLSDQSGELERLGLENRKLSAKITRMEPVMEALSGRLQKAARAPVSPIHPPQGHSSSVPAVLVADGDRLQRDRLARELEKAGFGVETASDGRDVLQKVMATPGRFAAVFLDMEMPRMSGAAACRFIRAWEAGREKQAGSSPSKVPVIGLGSRPGAEAAQKCRSAGMNGFMAKPVAGRALSAVIARYLPKPSEN